MSDQFELQAEVREDMGKGASRRLRRLADQVPAIIYGGDKDPQPLTLIRKDLEKALENEAFYSHVLTINVGKDKQKAILKDLQRHPARDSVMHADFLRVDDNEPIKVHVPIHFLNEDTCIGVKTEGGMVQHQATDIEVQCLPAISPSTLKWICSKWKSARLFTCPTLPCRKASYLCGPGTGRRPRPGDCLYHCAQGHSERR